LKPEVRQWDFPRSLDSVAILVGLGVDYGMTVAQCLAQSDLREADLQTKTRLISAESEIQVIRNLQRHLGHDRPLGLEAGQRYQLTTFGIWSFAVLSCRTARQAAETGVRFARLTSAYCDPRLENRGAEILMTATVDDLPEDVSQFLLERDAATVINIQRGILPMALPLMRFHCRFAKPIYASALDEFFQVDIQYEQEENFISAPADLGDVVLPRNNSLFFQRCEQECMQVLDRRRIHEGFAGKVRMVILREIHHAPTMAEISANFSVSSRTLRRRLQTEGVDFESLLEETRHALAEELLATTSFSIAEISERLGYRQTTNFIRAFRRWTGTSPLPFRTNNS
jgi:AraC-like DNA-binding protein